MFGRSTALSGGARTLGGREWGPQVVPTPAPQLPAPTAPRPLTQPFNYGQPAPAQGGGQATPGAAQGAAFPQAGAPVFGTGAKASTQASGGGSAPAPAPTPPPTTDGPVEVAMEPEPTLFDLGPPAQADPALGRRNPAMEGLLSMYRAGRIY